VLVIGLALILVATTVLLRRSLAPLDELTADGELVGRGRVTVERHTDARQYLAVRNASWRE
jgi:membrane protein implicated in regulation of membrane protease activity